MKFKKQLFGFMDMLRFKKLVPNRREALAHGPDTPLPQSYRTNVLAAKLHPGRMEVELTAVRSLTEGMRELTFRRVDGDAFPFFRAGQYVSLQARIGESLVSRPYSIASSPTRTIAGLRSFDQKIILIAGGYDKKIPYEPLAPEILAHVKVLVLMGATGPRIEKAVREDPDFAASDLVILHAESMEQAVELARQSAHPGDIVSLSPASASFDLYPNFEVRGRDYKRIVNALK